MRRGGSPLAQAVYPRRFDYTPDFPFFMPLFTEIPRRGVLGRWRDRSPKAFSLRSLLAWFAVERVNPLELKREEGAVTCTPD
jgi:hypothetical protein